MSDVHEGVYTFADCQYAKSRITNTLENRFGEMRTIEFATVEPCCQHEKYPYVIFGGRRDPLYCRKACILRCCPRGVQL
jgi:hypothetical protein